jgi:AcrR family transcriptional regulator
MVEHENQRLLDSRFHHVDLSGSSIRDSNMSGVDIRGTFAHSLRMRGVVLVDCSIEGEVIGLQVNGVDVSGYVESELDRLDPRRPIVRNPQTVADIAAAFDLMESLWEETVARARTFTPDQLNERVDDEFSFLETLRHLVFAHDCWVSRGILREPAPWHPLSLPWEEAEEVAEVPNDRSARPSLEKVLAIRADRLALVRRVLADLTDERLAEPIEPPDTPGFVGADQHDPIGDALRTVLNEEWYHRLFAERDLSKIEASTSESEDSA